MTTKQWIRDDDDEVTGFALFDAEYLVVLAYIHDNGGDGSSWMVNANGWFVGWAKDEAEARKMAEDRVTEDDEQAALKPRRPRGPIGPHSFGLEVTSD
jgi:hypothetical protein